jgi:transcriptional regulator with XRE-family HTH domain
MPRRPKLNPEQVAELRALAGKGATRTDLAARFGVSRTTVANLLRAGPPPVNGSEPGVARAAVEAFIQELGELRGERRAVAGLALVLADRVDGSPSVAGAAAAVAQLATLVEQLEAGQTQEEANVRARRALAAVGL